MAILQRVGEETFPGSTNYILRTHMVGLSGFTVPFTVNIWAWRDAGNFGNSSLRNVLTIYRQELGVGVNSYEIRQNTLNNFQMRASADGTGTNNGNTTVTVTDSQWHMVTMIVNSASSRSLYVNAGTPVTSTVTRNVATPTAIAFGAFTSGDAAFYGSAMDPMYAITEVPFGRSCELGVWDVALTTDEITSLYRGARTMQVRPQSLKLYAPMVRNISQDLVGKITSGDQKFRDDDLFDDSDLLGNGGPQAEQGAALVVDHSVRRYG